MNVDVPRSRPQYRHACRGQYQNMCLVPAAETPPASPCWVCPAWTVGHERSIRAQRAHASGSDEAGPAVPTPPPRFSQRCSHVPLLQLMHAGGNSR